MDPGGLFKVEFNSRDARGRGRKEEGRGRNDQAQKKQPLIQYFGGVWTGLGLCLPHGPT